MVKKFLLLALLILISKEVFADTNSYTANASPVVVAVNGTTTYKNITFPYTTRNLRIENADTNSYIFVDLKSDTNTSDVNSCILVKPASVLELFDFATNGISILADTVGYGSIDASPITVIATY